MQIMNTLATLATTTDPAQREAKLAALREEYAKLDSVARDSDVGRAATIVLQADEIAKLKAAQAQPAPAQAAPAPVIVLPQPAASAAPTQVLVGGHAISPSEGGTIVKDKDGKTVVVFPSEDAARRAIAKAINNGKSYQGAVDEEIAYQLAMAEADDHMNAMRDRGALQTPTQASTWTTGHTVAAILVALVAAGGIYWAVQRSNSQPEAN